MSCVVLTLGDRSAELHRALDSVAAQDGDPVEVVVVGNGVDVPDLPPPVRFVRLPENGGIPAGRNAGAAASSGELVLFLDDDGWLPQRGTVEHLRRSFGSRPDLGIVSMRICDPETGRSMRRHVPRLRAGDPERSSLVTTFLGGASVMRREVWRDCGGLPAGFFFAHEETDLAWQALDAGWAIEYDAEAVMCHPATAASRHELYYRLNARNRVWLARRNLPAALVPVYLGVWCALTVARTRDVAALRVWWRGFAEGWRTDPGARRPISWRTVLRMARLGRPPVV
ncbi:glycosyltransferase family 2 protein [Pedococcus sp. 5OH_020]|uniref:glycosyltransferase family 2 protein n=1 Tax=Pedococcus sp. 5OH_020 TaxID=2989814 RepID=UPI0022E9A722|nr:glycosyltransferase [Pedococcus sp. 5OH_020]